MLNENHYASKELKHRKKYLDMLCKSFADYMERKRLMISTSVKFHKNAIEVFAKYLVFIYLFMYLLFRLYVFSFIYFLLSFILRYLLNFGIHLLLMYLLFRLYAFPFFHFLLSYIQVNVFLFVCISFLKS